MTKTAELYGGSLYDLAVEENCSSEMMEELAQIRDLFRANPEYISLLAEPAIAKAERLSLIDQAFGTQAMPYIVNFLKILCEEGMMREFFGCCEAFRERYNKDHNIAEAVVTAAVPLTAAQAKALEARLEQISGKNILLIQKTDPAVIGGMKVELEGRQYDATISGRLSGVRRRMTEVVL